MSEAQHSRRAETDQARETPEQKSTTPKQDIQQTDDLTQLPVYTQMWGNQPPPWLGLPVQKQADQEEKALQETDEQPVQRKENHTGLPDTLKASVEHLSGLSMDDVKVHYSSPKPAEVQALAYTQGTEIHMSPGQEQHLAHEAWHAIQQKQGRVHPTLQAKGIPFNDDQKLEEEADVMSEKALQPLPAPASANPATAHGTPAIQRKISFSGFDDPPKAIRVYYKVVSALAKNKELLQSLFPEQFEEIFRELNDYTIFRLIVPDMVRSPIDYGEINLDNPQHVILFFKDAGKYLMRNYESQKEKEKPYEERDKSKRELWEKHKEDSPDKSPSKQYTYKTALLGTGASIAYYLAANGRSLNPKDTVIIGKRQPWDPLNPQGRGITFVNHPAHMTSPVRRETWLPEKESGEDEAFEGMAASLTEDIWQIIMRFSHSFNTTITKVSREEISGWYKIETGTGIFYADKVVFGLGIGPHQLPRNALISKITTEQDKAEERLRVMDLDTFQRQLKNPFSLVRRNHTDQRPAWIAVAGPNAGADAVYEATKLGMYVEWIVSEVGPNVAEGMGNKITSRGLVDLYFDYLNGWTISGKKVSLTISGKWEDDEQRRKAGEEFLRKKPGWVISLEKTVNVDFLVYAPGPNVATIWNVLDVTARKDLELKRDTQGRFGAIPLSPEPSHESIINGIKARVKAKTRIKVEEAPEQEKQGIESLLNDITFSLLDAAKKVLDIKDNFASIPLQTNVAIGLGATDNSLEIIGGSAIRFLMYLDAMKEKEIEKPEKLRPEEREELKKLPEKLRAEKQNEEMAKVLTTLSSPSILLSDQLTPIRSMIEAQGNFMPGYIGSKEANFVTDDQTMIAAHIVGYYSNIPPALVDWITRRIIQDRKESGVKPGTKAGGRTFVNKWKSTLKSLQNIFDAENIRKLIPPSLRKK